MFVNRIERNAWGERLQKTETIQAHQILESTWRLFFVEKKTFFLP